MPWRASFCARDLPIPEAREGASKKGPGSVLMLGQMDANAAAWLRAPNGTSAQRREQL